MTQLAAPPQTAARPLPGAALPHTRREEWALVQVWDGAVLAVFDDEVSARAAISGADDDEVVVLHFNT